MKTLSRLLLALFSASAIVACENDNSDTGNATTGGSASSTGGSSAVGGAATGGTHSGGTTTGGMSATGGAATGGGAGQANMSLCAKYGGAENVAKVVRMNVIGAIAGDCRINTFFTSLSADAFKRVDDCLTIQVQELFGCPGITYAGAKASNGLACRSMVAAHTGLGISTGDFDALIEDTVAGLTEAGVAGADIGAAAPSLLGLKPAIVESASTSPTKGMCVNATGGAGGAGGAGGSH
jgi:hypothetical protein